MFSGTGFSYVVFRAESEAGRFAIAKSGANIISYVRNNTATLTTSDKSYNDGAWHCIVVTRGSLDVGAKGHKLYVDGVLKKEQDVPAVDAGTSLLSIGATYVGGSKLTGSINDVAVLNVALTADEIATLYTQSSAIYAGGGAK